MGDHDVTQQSRYEDSTYGRICILCFRSGRNAGQWTSKSRDEGPQGCSRYGGVYGVCGLDVRHSMDERGQYIGRQFEDERTNTAIGQLPYDLGVLREWLTT